MISHRSYVFSVLAVLVAILASQSAVLGDENYGSGAQPVQLDKKQICDTGEYYQNHVLVVKHRTRPDDLQPECGYDWADRNESGSPSVKPLPAGTDTELIVNVMWVGDGERVRPCRGYRWKNPTDPSASDYEVVLREGFTGWGSDVVPPPGILWRTPNSLSDTRLRPAPGYDWVSNEPGDIRVRRIK